MSEGTLYLVWMVLVVTLLTLDLDDSHSVDGDAQDDDSPLGFGRSDPAGDGGD